MTKDDLMAIVPGLSTDHANFFLPHLNKAMDEFEIHTPLRQAAFIAQISHESGGFRWLEELWGPTAAQKNYEPPSHKARELGNTQPGDGRLYKGRGPIQISGRANYRKYGELLGVDLESNPTLASKPETGFRIAACYWKDHGLNELADQGEFKEITRAINGGLLGYDERCAYYERAKKVLNA